MKMLLLSAAIGIGLSTTAHADLIEADYLTEGDNLAVYDTLTQMTWLDLNVTTAMSVNEFVEAQRGGAFVGWRMPTFDEIESLFLTYAVLPGVTEIELGKYHSYIAGVADAGGTDLMAARFGTTVTNESPYGLVDIGGVYSVFGPSGQWGFHYGSGTYSADQNASNAGIFLVYDESSFVSDVSAASLGMVSLGVALMCLRRRKKK